MSQVSVSIGPTSGTSARAWLEEATRTIDRVRANPALGVPADVVADFDRYLAVWATAMEGDRFLWSGVVESETLRHLAAHWARLVTMARERPEESGIATARPEAAEFFDALALALADGLSRADDAERFAPKFEEVVPAFDAEGPSGATTESVAARRRVLLVDDNPDIRLLVRIGLESSGGFDVVGEACDGQEALDAVDRSCPDVVLLDLAMPVMDGFTALPLLKRRCPDMRVVVFSASDSASTRQRVTTGGCDAFLRKHAAIGDVVATLGAL